MSFPKLIPFPKIGGCINVCTIYKGMGTPPVEGIPPPEFICLCDFMDLSLEVSKLGLIPRLIGWRSTWQAMAILRYATRCMAYWLPGSCVYYIHIDLIDVLLMKRPTNNLFVSIIFHVIISYGYVSLSNSV